MPLELSYLKKDGDLKFYTNCTQKTCVKYTIKDSLESLASQLMFRIQIKESYEYNCSTNIDASVNIFAYSLD